MDIHQKLGLRRIINASGTMTVLGASAATPEAVEAASAILPRFVEIDDLQRGASRAIAGATGAEAGFVTASSAAAITLAVAATMTGSDLQKIARLPDTHGMPNSIAVQRGHLIDYGAPIEQAIRLAGGWVLPVGNATRAGPEQLEAALDDAIAAALYVVSHHTEQLGQISLADFVRICGIRKVPVIVDAASEYDLTGFVAAGADLVIYSAHKFLGGLTAGIVAGRKNLVRAAYLQNLGIGRGMKVGKEGIAAAIAALEAWAKRDHAASRDAEDARVAMWVERLDGLEGVHVERCPDPTGNPITRVRVHVGPASRTTAWDLADALAARDPAVMVRDDEVGHGFFDLDPCNLSDSEAEDVAKGIAAEMRQAQVAPRAPGTLADWSARRLAARLAWPD